ncbi:hypothetical protein MXD61_02740 [Frankia sp. AgPm24]|uniref:hypothetical protein n=1 Tax=Frankia sp. AgPm24 TaxID=631128 RepID=UPI00200D2D78|nr:hypothetical protein [Frankia sp. AgPm24]MCK9920833.1 hypothetical protein [Frankia sp. AgPm24]
MPADDSILSQAAHDPGGRLETPDAIPAARAGQQELPAANIPAPAAETHPTAITVEDGSELVDSLMSGMSAGEREHLLEMINTSIEAERTAAFDGTVRRQVDVGVRRRRSSRAVQGADDAGA